MAKEKEFIYSKVSEIGTLGKSTVEIGHYTVNGKEMPDKVYMVTKFSRKDGTESTKATAICSVADANELGKLLEQVK